MKNESNSVYISTSYYDRNNFDMYSRDSLQLVYAY